MAGQIPGLKAGADLSAKRYHFVYLTAVNTVTFCTNAADDPIGILQNAPASGEEAEVVSHGFSKLIVDGNAGAIAVMNMLHPDNLGKGIKTVTDLDRVGALALEASTTAGDEISVMAVLYTLSI